MDEGRVKGTAKGSLLEAQQVAYDQRQEDLDKIYQEEEDRTLAARVQQEDEEQLMMNHQLDEPPLISAIFSKNTDRVQNLLSNGADPRKKKDGWNSYDFALVCQIPEIKYMVLNWQNPEDGATQLINEIYNGNFERAKKLMKEGADPYLRKNDGTNAFYFAYTNPNKRFWDESVRNYKTSNRVSDAWPLVWSDEFDKGIINKDKWTHEVNGLGGYNSELQYYTDREKNSRINEDNQLVIEAHEEDYESKKYTSARLNTKGKADWKYGRFDIRAKLPRGQGIWPAIWMMPSHDHYGRWAASGEIDILETINLKQGEPHPIHGSIHFGNQPPHNKNRSVTFKSKANLIDEFHVYSIEWEETEIRWYIDGHLYGTQKEWYTKADKFPAPFNREFHLIVNLAVGGDWPGSPREDTVFPQRLEIDYVRVFQWPSSY